MRQHFLRCGVMMVIFAGAMSLQSAALACLSLGSVVGKGGVAKDKIEVVRDFLERALANIPAKKCRTNGAVSAVVSQLDSVYVLAVTRTPTDGASTQREELRLSSLDELDTASQRLAQSLASGRGVEDTVARGAVTDRERQSPSTVGVSGGYDFSLGFGLPVSNALRTHKGMFAIGTGYSWEINRFLIDARGDFMSGYNQLGMSATTVTVGGGYNVINGRTVAFLAELEAGFGHVRDKLTSGKSAFVFATDLIARAPRYAKINLDARVRTTFFVDKLNGSVPIITSFLIGVHF